METIAQGIGRNCAQKLL